MGVNIPTPCSLKTHSDGRTLISFILLTLARRPCFSPPLQGYGTGLMPWRDENSPPIEDYIDDPMDNPEDDAVLGRGRANVAAAIKSLGYTP